MITGEPTTHQAWEANANSTKVTQRGSRWYRQLFNIMSEEPILDLGTGKSWYAPNNLIRADYAYKGYRPRKGRGHNVAALFQQLPFENGALGGVISSYGLYNLRGNGVKPVLDEALRVVKPGGTVQIYPVTVRDEALADSMSIGRLTGLRDHPQPPYALRNTVGGLSVIDSMMATAGAGLADYLHGGESDLLIGGGSGLAAGIALTVWALNKIRTNVRRNEADYRLLSIARDESLGNTAVRAAFVSSLTDAYNMTREGVAPSMVPYAPKQ